MVMANKYRREWNDRLSYYHRLSENFATWDPETHS